MPTDNGSSDAPPPPNHTVLPSSSHTVSRSRRSPTASSPSSSSSLSSSSSSSAAFQIVFPISRSSVSADRHSEDPSILQTPEVMAPPDLCSYPPPAIGCRQPSGKLRRSQSHGLRPDQVAAVHDDSVGATDQEHRHIPIHETPQIQSSRNDSIKTITTTRSSRNFNSNGILSGILACLNPCKAAAMDPPPLSPMSANRKVAALLEISKQQQLELANKQDTIDMLEFQLEQMRSMEKQIYMEEEQYSAMSRELQLEQKRLSDEVSSTEMMKLDGFLGRSDGHGGKNVQRKGLKVWRQSSEEEVVEIEEYRGCNATSGGYAARSGETTSSSSGGGTSTGSGSSCGSVTNSSSRSATIISRDFTSIPPILASDRTIITLALFEMATVRARFAVRSFAKSLIKHLEAFGYPVAKTLSELEPEVSFLRKEHALYALESRINRAMYQSFENDNYDETGITQILNPAERCAARLGEFQRLKLVGAAEAAEVGNANYDAEFRRFCERKARSVGAGLSWWGGEGAGLSYADTGCEGEAFTAAFLDAAKGVWLLHKLAYAMQPHVVILRVGKGMLCDPAYVEPVAEFSSHSLCSDCSKTHVEFLVFPGFQALDKVIKCQVYPHLRCRP